MAINWERYWRKFKDINTLKIKSSQLDDTLAGLEKEFSTKFMSGDHMAIHDALEDRIEELEKELADKNMGIQSDLFD